MNCHSVRTWILRGDPLRNAPADVMGHVRTCPTCQEYFEGLARLEDSYRFKPIPISAWAKQALFLRRLFPNRHISGRQHCLAAALIMLAFLGFLWLAAPGARIQAASNVLDNLIDWNLSLANLSPGSDLHLSHGQRSHSLGKELQSALLCPEDREFGEFLLNFGNWQVHHNDPLEQADRFAEVADRMIKRMQSAKDRNKVQDSNWVIRQYRRILEQGITNKIDMILKAKTLDHHKKKHLEKLLARNSNRLEALNHLVEDFPDASRRELRKVIEHGKKQQRKLILMNP